MTSTAGAVILTTGILRYWEKNTSVFFNLLQMHSEKGKKKLKPCGRTRQFSSGLHCQSKSSAGQKLIKGCLASHIIRNGGRNK
jgi:hypothetical protein